MGSDSINLGLENIYKSWFNYRKGKKPNIELDEFQYNLENELFKLHEELNVRTYKHGCYRKFTVCDNKKREISVASVRDRLVHRLVYDYLTPIYDKTFIFDAWSCRVGKGLLGAIERTQDFLRRNSMGYIWKADVKKFFDNVDHDVLKKILNLRIHDPNAIWLIHEIIDSYPKGMPIGNLTSQIFSNIYLNELDRFVKHNLGVKFYLRYGDDFIIINTNVEIINSVTEFLSDELKLTVKKPIVVKASSGLKFLGVKIWPNGRTLNRRNRIRIFRNLALSNLASYYGLLQKHGDVKQIRYFSWLICEKL